MLHLRTPKELNKNLRTKIKRTNLKKQRKYSLEYKEYRDAVAECLN